MTQDPVADGLMSGADQELPMLPLVARVRLSLWLRLFVAIPCLVTIVAIGFSLGAPESLPWAGFPIAVGLGVLGITALNAHCGVKVTQNGMLLSYWILFRTFLPASAVASIDAAEWDTWSYNGVGIKGRPRSEKGLLLNASYDASGNADHGLLITTLDGRSYRIEVSDPLKTAEQARLILGITLGSSPG